ncbi:transcriptional regulator [Rouxiella silvae]|uniref:Transcriptional regulator n=1 Tax=Rouxiella silvae TaxID=1646373 RepID=A0ABX3TU08_9GAMM|nr:conserved phage C-terminal domain-containing protein [Rouxiella silvae]ORJ18686.1 transcriptional regulator [Rouxiella silvae]
MSLLLKTQPLVISPILAQRIGLNEAIVIQQICYWLQDTNSGVEHSGKKWVYNSIESWNEQFPFWSHDTVKRTLTSLKKLGLVDARQLNKSKHDRTNFYSINWNSALLCDEGNLHPSKRAKTTLSIRAKSPSSIGANSTDLTETTTEITTENKTLCQVPAETDREVQITDDAKSVLQHLNQLTNRRWQVSKSSLSGIRGRLNEGFTAEQLILTVDYMVEKWRNDEEMCDFLRPTTLFQPTKFPGYQGSSVAWDKKGRPARVNGKWVRNSSLTQATSDIPEGFNQNLPAAPTQGGSDDGYI